MADLWYHNYSLFPHDICMTQGPSVNATKTVCLEEQMSVAEYKPSQTTTGNMYSTNNLLKESLKKDKTTDGLT